MPRIPARFAPLLSPTSDMGARVTTAELAATLPAATAAEITTLKTQALDVLSDSAAVAKLLGQNVTASSPSVLTSLNDKPAGRALLGGQITISSSNAAANRDAVTLLQRALMKIGAHHPGAAGRPELLMMPYGADGGLGSATITAVNSALALAGRSDLHLASTASPMGAEVARVVELLLSATPRVVHPALVNPPVTDPNAGTPRLTLFGRTMHPTADTGVGLHARWTDVLRRMDAEAPRWVGEPLQLPVAARFLLSELDDAANRTRGYQVQKVNSVINGWRYAADDVTYGTGDHWATPLEFFANQRGDCEDYCIAKYATLKRLGISDDKMRIIICMDRDAGLAHAVLAVDLADGTYILDNQTTRALKAEDVKSADGGPRYTPLLALSRSARWLFG